MSAIAAGAWIVGSAVVSGVMSNRQKQIKNEQLVTANAYREASIDAEIRRQQDALSAQSREVQEVYQRNQLRIEQQGAVRAAEAQVASAAAGTKGQSVDMTQTAIQHSEGTQVGNLERQTEAQLNRIDQAFRDIAITGEASKKVLDLDTSMTGAGLANLFQNVARMNIGFSL